MPRAVKAAVIVFLLFTASGLHAGTTSSLKVTRITEGVDAFIAGLDDKLILSVSDLERLAARSLLLASSRAERSLILLMQETMNCSVLGKKACNTCRVTEDAGRYGTFVSLARYLNRYFTLSRDFQCSDDDIGELLNCAFQFLVGRSDRANYHQCIRKYSVPSLRKSKLITRATLNGATLKVRT